MFLLFTHYVSNFRNLAKYNTIHNAEISYMYNTYKLNIRIQNLPTLPRICNWKMKQQNITFQHMMLSQSEHVVLFIYCYISNTNAIYCTLFRNQQYSLVILCVNYLCHMKHRYNITLQILSGETGNGFSYGCATNCQWGLVAETICGVRKMAGPVTAHV